MKKRFSVRAIILTAALSVVFTLGAAALGLWLFLGPSGMAVAIGAGYINTCFVGEYDEDAMADAALTAMVNTLGDRWSYYMNAEDYQAQKLRRDNAYVGIGVTVLYAPDGLHIDTVTPGGPAEEAGLLPGEIITGADGISLTGDDVYRGTELIQGVEGTQVRLTVVNANGAVREVTVTRARIQSDPVRYELLEGGVGYVSLSNFYSGSAQRVEDAVEDLLSRGAHTLLFDMRDNPGGYLNELTDLLDYLLPEGPIFQSGDRSGPRKTTRSDDDCVDVPMAVLVNRNTYSAAELFAAQLRESVGAYLVGQPTFGKGYSQQTFALPGGRALNISTRTYYTGGGVSLIGVGLIPDEVLELSAQEDTQRAAAADYLRSLS